MKEIAEAFAATFNKFIQRDPELVRQIADTTFDVDLASHEGAGYGLIEPASLLTFINATIVDNTPVGENTFRLCETSNDDGVVVKYGISEYRADDVFVDYEDV